MKINKPKLKFYVLISLIILVVITSLIFHAEGYNFHLERYLIHLKSNPNLPLIYVSLYFVSSFFPLPFLTFLGATIFPFYKVFILSMIGNTLSFVIMFYLTRWLGRDYIEIYEKKHARLKNLDVNINKNSFLYVFLLRLFFIIPPEAVNILAGLSKMRFRKYITASILGTMPVILFSIALIKSYQTKNFYLLLISVVIFTLCIALPLIFMKGLRKYFKREKN